MVLLDEQDRGLWDRDRIAEGLALLERARAAGGAGAFTLQAAIAAEHARAATPQDTRWDRIAALYHRLAAVERSPVVALNRAVALAMADGPARGLAEMDALGDALDGYHLLHAARADLLRRLGRRDEAAAAYRRAHALAAQASERRFLERRLAELSSGKT
jgi:RNA polymerase sigma-70 factor (ECF subfamily)